MKQEKKYYYWFYALFGISIILAFYKISYRSLWLDEIATYSIIKNNLMNFIKSFESTYPPLYLISMFIWTKIFSYSELALRSFSAVFYILAGAAGFCCVKKIYNAKTAIIFYFIYIFNAFAIHYSQQTRCYMMLMFFSMLSSFYFYFYFKDDNRPLTKLLYIIFSACAIYIHYYAIFVLTTHFVIYLIYRPKQIHKFLFLGIIIFILYLPWFFILLKEAGTVHDWFKPVGLYAFFRLLYTLAAGYSLPLIGTHPAIKYPFTLLFLLLMIRGLIKIENKKIIIDLSFDNLFFLYLLFLPAIFAFIVSFLLSPIFMPKYLIICLIPFLILIAKGIKDFNKLKYIILIVYLVFSIISLKNYYTKSIYEQEDWREASKILEKNIDNDTYLIFSAYYVKSGFEYYYKGPYRLIKYKVNKGHKVDDETIKEIKGKISDKKKIILIKSHSWHTDKQERIKKTLDKEKRIITLKKLNGIEIYFYE